MDEPQLEFGAGLRAHLGFPADPPPAGPPEPADEPPDPVEEELGRRLAYLAAAEAALVAREREVNERESALAARDARLAEEASAARQSVRALLRRRAEESAERLWSMFDEALDARDLDGRPDFAIRLAAVRELLAAAYAGDGAEDEAADGAPARLTLLRRADGA